MKALIISRFTFLEVIRSKILIGLLMAAFAVLLITYIISEFAYGAASKVSLDVGLGIMSITNLGIAIFLGATLISKEIESKTLYMIISRPISRSTFLFGKILGLTSIIILNTLFLGAISFLIYNLLGGKLNELMYFSCLFSFLEALLIILITVFFSLITNVTLTIIFSLSVAIVGHSISTTFNTYFAKSNGIIFKILQLGSFLIPDLERFNLKDYLIYNQKINPTYLISTIFYFLLYFIIFSIFTSMIINKKNLD